MTIEKMNPREIRHAKGLNQQQFWSVLGVTQSGGSRYESGRKMPNPVRELLRLVHIEGIDIAKVQREDVEIAEFLKAQEPEMYETVRKAVQKKNQDEKKAA